MHEEDLISFQELKLAPKFHRLHINKRSELISKSKLRYKICKYSQIEKEIMLLFEIIGLHFRLEESIPDVQSFRYSIQHSY